LALKKSVPRPGYSVRRVNQVLATIFAFLLVAIVTEAFVNGFSQMRYLNPVVFAMSVGILSFLVVGYLIGNFAYQSHLFWARAIAIYTLVQLAIWPLHFDGEIAVPDGFKPWIWWLLGVSAIAAGTSFPFVVGVAYIVTISLGWVAIRVSPSGGSGELVLTIQDALHLFVLASIGTAMAMVLRWQAAKTDFANQNLIKSGVKIAQGEAISLEQTRLDALVHDNVLTTLLVASKAQTPEEISLASKSASEAIRKLRLDNGSLEIASSITQVSFFDAIRKKILRLYPDFQVSLNQTNDSQLSEITSQALTEATLQAADNSIKHAGRAGTRRVLLQSNGGGIKIVISDNGKGFRPSKISKDRLGIALSIIGRVKSVGGRVFIRSEPGKGTDVVLEWSPSA